MRSTFMRSALLMALCAAWSLPLFGERFVFKQQTGDKSRIISTTKEEVYRNGALMHRAHIVNRMASEIISVNDGNASVRAVFDIAEETETEDKTKQLHWGEEYTSEFVRDTFGKITIGKQYFMPSVRTMAVFPDREVNQGDSWISAGEEAFDLRRIFEIKEPYAIPFRANINYAGVKQWKGKSYKTFVISYSLLKNLEGFESSPRDYIAGTRRTAARTPSPAVPATPVLKRITGKSTQTLYWDEKLGQPAGAEDEYELNFELTSGETYKFKGKTVSEMIEADTMNKTDAVQQIREAVNTLDIKDVSVKAADEGITISLDDIQFAPDSAELLASEKAKLDKLGAILRTYQNRDILISGHTAQAGSSESSRVSLSQERAGAVANYLIQSNVRAPERIITRGYGSSRPVASNNSEEGRRKNRRVEITILEN